MNSKAMAFLSAYLIALFVCLSFLLSSVFFRFGISITPVTVYVSCFLSILAGLYVGRRYFTYKAFLCSLTIFCAAILLSFILSLFFIDVSWDGQTYHQETVIQLAQGWNPFLKALDPHNAAEKALFLLSNHFPKASEITEAGFYAVVRHIESGKALNLLLMMAAFFFTLSSLMASKRFTLRKAMILSLLAAFNPVTLCQSLTFYLDGNLYSLFVCLLSLLYLFYLERKTYVAILLILMSVYFINIKFTGLVYFCIGFFGFMLIVLLKRETAVLKKALIIFICSLVVGVFVCGYSPYVTNYKSYHHPFYPLKGEGASDTLKNDIPNSRRFQEMNNSLERFAVSLFSEGNIYDVKMKIPFTVNRSELNFYTYPDLRLGGFGPLFSGILILAFILVLGSIGSFKENRVLYGVVSVIVISTIINPAAWWARFVPQFWLVPILIAAFVESNKKLNWMRALQQTVLLLIFLNITIIAVPYVSQKMKDRKAVDEEVKELAKRGMPLHADFGVFRSNRIRLKERGLPYVEEQGLLDSTKLYQSQTRILLK
jgi:hypothetical protein